MAGESEDPHPKPDREALTAEAVRRVAEHQMQQLLSQLRQGVPPEGRELERLDDERQVALADKRLDVALKSTYARRLLWLLVFQLGVTDIVFVVYAWAGVDWHLTAGVIQVWLAATLVEIIGVVTVVTRYLFPRRDAQG